MKKILFLLLLGISLQAKAQADELAQLALNIEKLAQFKQILSDLKKAYTILYNGYNTVKNIAEGNFNLHQTFLDGLLQVSPAVRQYHKVAGIVSMQLQMVKQYKSAYRRFSSDPQFTVKELDYISNTYSKLVSESLKNLDALVNVITANTFRMSDEERLKAIDAIFASVEDKLVFLQHFNSSTSVLSVQRSKEQTDINALHKLYFNK